MVLFACRPRFRPSASPAFGMRGTGRPILFRFRLGRATGSSARLPVQVPRLTMDALDDAELVREAAGLQGVRGSSVCGPHVEFPQRKCCELQGSAT